MVVVLLLSASFESPIIAIPGHGKGYYCQRAGSWGVCVCVEKVGVSVCMENDTST